MGKFGVRLLPPPPSKGCCKILTAPGPPAPVRPAKGSPESPPKPAAGLAAGPAPDAAQRGPGPGGRRQGCPAPGCGCTWLRPRPARCRRDAGRDAKRVSSFDSEEQGQRF